MADQAGSLRSSTSTPSRKRKSLIGTIPGTPGSDGHAATTPVKRVPILANFEEWMKMATDNKINAQNSWNFALIDYFHDMSLLREGNSVNFQKASCTLDGCVKIYTSRVDSVATETGKLLSGLAESKNKDGRVGLADDDGDGDGENGSGDDRADGQARARRKAHRSAETTLAKSFKQLQAKKLELDFNVDPLLKKASADFDEGGAKGLLMNQLSIDCDGRIVFSSNDDAPAKPASEDGEQNGDDGEQEANDNLDRLDDMSDNPVSDDDPMDGHGPNTSEPEVDVARLGATFFPNLAQLDSLEICPTFKNFSLGETDTKAAMPLLNIDGWKGRDGGGAADVSGIFFDGENAMDFDDDDYEGAGLDLGGADIGFGDGGEAWAKEAALDMDVRPMHEVSEPPDGDDDADQFSEKAQFEVVMRHEPARSENNILSFFDEDLRQNWAGPEHWRIRRVKEVSKPVNGAAAPKRKEKEPFSIDFEAPITKAMADMLYTDPTTTGSILLPKTQWRSKTRNLLPDDKHFNSKSLLRLFTKPKARVGMFRSGITFQSAGRTGQNSQVGHSGQAVPAIQLSGAAAAETMDEQFWARKNHEAAIAHAAEEEKARADGLPAYDANFFQDDDMPLGGLGMADDLDDDFVDAQDGFPPALEVEGTQAVPVFSQPSSVGVGGRPSLGGGADGFDAPPLIIQTRRNRPDYVQYARTAKRVDVRRLKEEMWKGIGFSDTPVAGPSQPTQDADGDDMMDVDVEPKGDVGVLAIPELGSGNEDQEFRFTEVIQGLRKVYPRQSMADISTSYCFICLLHLANEKGLVIENTDNFEELVIKRDWSAAQAQDVVGA